MAKAIPIDKLTEAVDKILSDFGERETGVCREAVTAIAKAGVAAVKAEAKQKLDVKGSSEYVKGWTSTIEAGRLSTKGIIYNKAVPGLPHLLEYGHVSRNGTGRTFGKVEGRVHIAPVEKVVEAALLKTLRRTL